MITFSSCVKMVSERLRKPRNLPTQIEYWPNDPIQLWPSISKYYLCAIRSLSPPCYFRVLPRLVYSPLEPTIFLLGKIFLTKDFHSLQNKSKLQEFIYAHIILPKFYFLLSHIPAVSGICRLSWDPAGNLIIF